MRQPEAKTGQPEAKTGQPPYQRTHGTQLVINTRRGKKIPIPCPRCRRRTEERFWHTELEQGICDRCWRELEKDRLPEVLTP